MSDSSAICCLRGLATGVDKEPGSWPKDQRCEVTRLHLTQWRIQVDIGVIYFTIVSTEDDISVTLEAKYNGRRRMKQKQAKYDLK
jgi:hypothetical protein